MKKRKKKKISLRSLNSNGKRNIFEIILQYITDFRKLFFFLKGESFLLNGKNIKLFVRRPEPFPKQRKKLIENLAPGATYRCLCDKHNYLAIILSEKCNSFSFEGEKSIKTLCFMASKKHKFLTISSVLAPEKKNIFQFP